MRLFLLLLSFLFLSNNVLFSQQKTKKPSQNINVKKALARQPLNVPVTPQNFIGICPPNIDFEQASFNNWVCFSGSIATGIPNMSVTPPIKGIHTITNVPNPLPVHPIMSPYDTFANIKLNPNIPIVCPYDLNGRYSARIGNSFNNMKAQALMYMFQIPPGQKDYRITFYYAIVMQNPVGHTLSQMPRFQIAVSDVDGNPIGSDCNNFLVTPLTSNYEWYKIPPSTQSNPGTDTIFYKPWSIGTINLAGVPGNVQGDTVVLQFVSTDCSLGGHWGYAYVDVAQSCTDNLIQISKYCQGAKSATVTLPTGYKTYNWWDTSYTKSISHSKTVSFTPAPPDTTVYNIELIPYPNQGCIDTGKVLLIETPLPKISPIYGDTAVCVGKQIQLYDSTPGFNYTSNSFGIWNTGPAGKANIIVSTTKGIIQGKSAGWAKVRFVYTDSLSPHCYDSVGYFITVNPLPTFSPIIGDSAVCAGKSVQFSDTALGGTWYLSDNTLGSIDNTGKFTSITPGTLYVRYSKMNIWGCVDSVSKLITVNPMPVITPITGNTSECYGKLTTLSASPTGVWYSVDTTIATIDSISGIMFGNKKGSTTIRNVVTTDMGCKDSSSAIVTINPLPIVNPIKGLSNVCIYKTTTLTNDSLHGTWISNYDTIATINGGVITGIGVGNDTITYIVSTSYGCIDSVHFNLVVNPLPIIATINGNAQVCFGKVTTLTNTTTGGKWTSANQSIATVDASGNVTGINDGNATIRYIVTSGLGCIDSVATNFVVNPLPIIQPIGGKNAVCIGDSTILTNSISGGIWSTADATIANINDSLVYGTKSGQTTIRYTVTNNFGCVDSVGLNFNVVSKPIIPAITGDSVLCLGVITTLSDKTSNGVWHISDNTVSTINSSTGVITPNKLGNATVNYLVTVPPGCTDSISYNIRVNSFSLNSPVSSVANPIVQTTPVTISTSGLSTDNYSIVSWLPIVNFSGQSGLTLNFTADTSIKICAVGKSTSGGCLDTSCIDIKVTPLNTSIKVPNVIKLSANSAKNAEVKVISTENLKSMQIRIFNQWGEMVFSTNDINVAWNGMTNGVFQPGVYVYVLKAVTLDNKNIDKKGSITLIK